MAKHGSAADRGSADRYYGRQADPHKYEGGTYTSPRITLKIGDPEYDEYMEAYENEDSRKDWR